MVDVNISDKINIEFSDIDWLRRCRFWANIRL
jgi:hypothetical protein